MFRMLLLTLFMGLCFGAKAQWQPVPHPADTAYNYFKTLRLDIDSAQTQLLFYKVYEWLNTKYKYGGNNKQGTDCSGFTCNIYREVYCLDVIRGSAELYRSLTPINKKDLREGDFVFFKIKRNKISHVGIYLGHNKFAHAAVIGGVIVSDLDEEYYRKRFYKGGRIK